MSEPVLSVGGPAAESSLAGVPAGVREVRDGRVVPATSGLAAGGLHAFFGRKQVLRDISMAVAPRAVTAVMGPSGCGKSTFIRCLNRLHETVPGARVTGRVLLDGVDIYASGIDPMVVRRRVGMVFQKPTVFPTHSLFDNVAMGLRLGGVPRRLWAERVEESLRRAALWDEVKDRLRDPAAALSGGQQQRLCIARAIAVEPEVLLLDEPCSALDPASTQRIEDLLAELKGRFAILIVTHNLQQAARVSDYVAFFLNGERVEFGPSSEVFTRPRDPRTEAYLTGRFG